MNHPTLNFDENRMCLISTQLFNSSLKQVTGKFGHNLIDVYRFTSDKDGFSNQFYHVDDRHLGPQAIPQLETILGEI